MSGSDSTWRNDNTLYVGNFGSGTLNIMDGGTVISRYGKLGYRSDSIGTVNVDGAGTKWTNNGTLNVGENGNGVMSVTGGGEVSNAYGYLYWTLAWFDRRGHGGWRRFGVAQRQRSPRRL